MTAPRRLPAADVRSGWPEQRCDDIPNSTLDPAAWYNAEDQQQLRRAVNHVVGPTQIAVEFGGWVGTSAIVLADYFECVMVVDPWVGLPGGPVEYQDAGDAYLRFLQATEHVDEVTRFRCTADEFRRVYDGPCDFVHIDHLHDYEETATSILWALSRIRRGGVVCGHDYGHDHFPGVKRAVDELLPMSHHGEGLVWWQEVSNG